MFYEGKKITWNEYQLRKNQHAETMLLLFDHKANAEITDETHYEYVRAQRSFIGEHLNYDRKRIAPIPRMENPFISIQPTSVRNDISAYPSSIPAKSPDQISPLTTPRNISHRAASVPIHGNFFSFESPGVQPVKQSPSAQTSQSPAGNSTPRTPRNTPRSSVGTPRTASQIIGFDPRNSGFESRLDKPLSLFDCVISGLKETASVKRTDSKGWIRDMEKRNDYLEKYCKKLETENNQILLRYTLFY